MDDMTAFERQVQRRVHRFVGPARSVDDLAVFEAVIAATHSPKRRLWSASMPSVGGTYVRVIGRTQVMFSPVKAIIAGALVFALGGMFMIAQPYQQSDVGAPGAQSDVDGPITPVTGTLLDSSFDDSGSEYSVDEQGVGHHRGVLATETYQWDDDRLPPLKRVVMNFDMYPNAGTGDIWVATSTDRLDGADGYWEGTGHLVGPVDGSSPTVAGVYFGAEDVLVGHGAYDGLVAVLSCTAVSGCSGYIFEGEMPPHPDPIELPAE